MSSGALGLVSRACNPGLRDDALYCSLPAVKAGQKVHLTMLFFLIHCVFDPRYFWSQAESNTVPLAQRTQVLFWPQEAGDLGSAEALASGLTLPVSWCLPIATSCHWKHALECCGRAPRGVSFYGIITKIWLKFIFVLFEEAKKKKDLLSKLIM